jgi:hypothetical protein
MPTVVTCGNCSKVLSERSDTEASKRSPCPNCGSTVRQFNVTMEAAVTLDAAMSLVVVQGEKPKPPDLVLEDAGFDVSWQRLSEGGAWLVFVRDREGNLVDGSMADEPEEAILAVVDRLIP